MKILIVDDEPLARSRLRALLDELGCYYEVVGEAGNAKDAADMARVYQPDVLLLDIGMPGMSGMELAKHLGASAPALIFTTAYSEFALEAFERQAVDYLLKPVRKERLHAALQRAEKLRPVVQRVPGSGTTRTHLSITFLGTLRLIPIEKIYYFKAEQKYVTVRWERGEAITDEPLVELEREFAGQFVRVHRNALAALVQIEQLKNCGNNGYCIAFYHIPDILEVSRRHVSELRRRLRDMHSPPLR